MFFVVFPNLSVTLTLIQKIMNVINVKDKRVFRNTSRELTWWGFLGPSPPLPSTPRGRIKRTNKFRETSLLNSISVKLYINLVFNGNVIQVSIIKFPLINPTKYYFRRNISFPPNFPWEEVCSHCLSLKYFMDFSR